MKVIKYPASIDWEVTPFCNHNCIHCYNCWRSEEDKNKDIIFNKKVSASYYLDIAKILVKNHPVSVIITGGEPLSVFEKNVPAIKYLKENNIYVSMNTNITFLTEDIAFKIKELDIPIFTSIPSCIPENCDKITKVKGSFYNIDKALKLCIKYKIPVTTNMVVTKVNVNDIDATAEYIHNLGLNYFCCTKAAFPANADKELHKEILTYEEFSHILSKLLVLKDKYNFTIDSAWAYSLCGLCDEHIKTFGFKRRCGAGRFNFAITCDGDIKACNVDTTIYGNIFKDSDISNAIEKMTSWQDNSYLPEDCKDCKSLYLCGGGCRLEAKNTFGDITHLDSTANKENIDREVTPPAIHKVIEDDLYVLNKDIIFTDEINCVRMSRRVHYEFITNECRQFFKDNKEFSLKSFVKNLDLSSEMGEIEFSNFLDKNFIIKKGELL